MILAPLENTIAEIESHLKFVSDFYSQEGTIIMLLLHLTTRLLSHSSFVLTVILRFFSIAVVWSKQECRGLNLEIAVVGKRSPM